MTRISHRYHVATTELDFANILFRAIGLYRRPSKKIVNVDACAISSFGMDQKWTAGYRNRYLYGCCYSLMEIFPSKRRRKALLCLLMPPKQYINSNSDPWSSLLLNAELTILNKFFFAISRFHLYVLLFSCSPFQCFD